MNRRHRRLSTETLESRCLLSADGTGIGGVDGTEVDESTSDYPVVRMTSELVEELDRPVLHFLTFELDRPAEKKISFEFTSVDHPDLHGATDDDGELSNFATARTDYRPRRGKVTFHRGQTVQRRGITILGDRTTEDVEEIVFELKNPVDILFADASPTLSILDDDSSVVWLTTTSVDEGTNGLDAGVLNGHFLEFRLDAPSATRSSFDFELIDGSATIGSDVRKRSATVTFHPGQTVQRRRINVIADLDIEGDETFGVALKNPQGLSLQSDEYSVAVLDDDFPSLEVVSSEVVEGDQIGTFDIEFALSEPAAVPVSFDVSSTEGDAISDVGFSRFQETVTFAPGETTQVAKVTILGDNEEDPDRVIQFELSNPVGLRLDATLGEIALIDDDTRPQNIIYIMLDDADYNDVGFQSEDAVTPNIDQLRAGGLAMTSFYSASSICSPTRASVLTGQNPLNFGLNTIWPQHVERAQNLKGMRGLPNTIPQLADELRETGMATAHFGKWHVGASLEEYRPSAKGFDEWYLPMLLPNDTASRVGWLHTHSGSSQVADSDHVTSFTTDLVVDFVERKLANDEPFFADVWYYAPHWPWHVPPGFDNSDLNFNLTTPRGKLLAMMYDVDQGIGRIVDALERAGALEDTLVVFTSDNGGQRQVRMPRSELRGAKGGFNEGGIRVPLVAHWPAQIAPNSTNDSVMVTTDLFPTLLEFRGVDAVGVAELESEIDGTSRVDQFLSNERFEHEPILWHANGASTLQRNPADEYTYAYRDGDYKIIKYEGHTTYRLYDIRNDPGERVNLAGREPELLRSMVDALTHRRREVSRVPFIPTTIDAPTVVPFDPRLDISSGEMTLVFEICFEGDSEEPRILFNKPDSWKLTLQPDRSVQLDVYGVTRTGEPTHRSLSSPALSRSVAEIGIVFGGFKNDHTTIDIYIDGQAAASLPVIDRPWNLWSSTSPLYVGSEGVDLTNVRMHLNRFRPHEWSPADATSNGEIRSVTRSPVAPAPSERTFWVDTATPTLSQAFVDDAFSDYGTTDFAFPDDVLCDNTLCEMNNSRASQARRATVARRVSRAS